MQMFQTIKDFDEVHADCFVQLYNVTLQIEKQMLDFLVAHQNRIALGRQISLQQRELDAAVRTKTRNENFTTSYKWNKLFVVETARHNTICGSSNCNSNCHVPCGCPPALDKEQIKACSCFDSSSNYTCKVCKHSYKDHFHSKSVFETREEVSVITDQEQKERFEDAKSQELLCLKLIAEYDANLKQCDQSMVDLKVALISAVDTFQNLGSCSSYEKMLESQLYVLDQIFETQQMGDNLQVLFAIKKG